MANIKYKYNEKFKKMFRKGERVFYKDLVMNFSEYIKKNHNEIKNIEDVSENYIINYFKSLGKNLTNKEVKMQISDILMITRYDIRNIENGITKYKLDKCPYCGGSILFKKDSSCVYQKDYGPIYVCENYPKCDSYVGTHPNTTIPLGRLADAELRKYKKLAHEYFDILWQCKKNLGDNNARHKGYRWLAAQLNMDVMSTHIGWFNKSICNDVINICKPYYLNLKQKKSL